LFAVVDRSYPLLVSLAVVVRFVPSGPVLE
jgi:hypothetical protein